MSSSASAPVVALTLEPDQCIGCAICADVCPSQALAMGPEEVLPLWVPEQCNGCTICARQCPTGAITVTRGGASPTP